MMWMGQWILRRRIVCLLSCKRGIYLLWMVSFCIKVMITLVENQGMHLLGMQWIRNRNGLMITGSLLIQLIRPNERIFHFMIYPIYLFLVKSSVYPSHIYFKLYISLNFITKYLLLIEEIIFTKCKNSLNLSWKWIYDLKKCYPELFMLRNDFQDRTT